MSNNFCDTCLHHIVACTCCPTCKGPHSEETHPTKLPDPAAMANDADAFVKALPLIV